ncbi:MAG TPA: fibronectin type III domain-containing protein [Terriglobales bacterium]|nr:fibronectin type III domain-containing protein [Terriglobales bacterium]
MNVARYLHRVGCFAVILGLAGCGVPGVPRPPSLNLPQPATDLRGVRKGDKVFLAWTVPTETTDSLRVRRLGITQICRNTDTSSADCAKPVGTLAPPTSANSQQKTPSNAKVTATYTDQLTPAILSTNPASEFFYAVSVLNQNGRSAGLSNKVTVPAVVALPPPLDFQAQVTADGIQLSWTNPPHGAKTPGLHHLFRVYRRELGTKANTVAGEIPFGTSATYVLLDHGFEWEKTYDYRATVVDVIDVKGHPEIQFEGNDTPPKRVFAHDIFPPAVPSGLQAVFSGPGQQPFIDLIWTPDTDADLAGYNVYRHEPGASEEKINSALIKTPAFRDTNVAPSHSYTYSVSAIDVRGNESAHSAEASEHVP